MFSNKSQFNFQDVIATYKIKNTVDQPFENKYDKNEDLIAHVAIQEMLD